MNKKYIGLTNREIENNQKMYGKNIIHIKKQNKFFKNIISIIKEPIFLLLLICIILYIILKEYIYTLILSISIVCMLLIKLYQKYKINKIDNNLRKLIPDYCTVIRNGKEETITIEELTIDDILLLKEGDKVSADAIILENYNLYTDESCFTNNNTPVKKSCDLMDKNALLKSNYVYKDTFITKGYGISKVISIGNNTEIAKKETYSNIIENHSSLQIFTKKLAQTCVIISIIVLILTFILCIIAKMNIITSLINAIAGALICLFTRATFNLTYLISKEKEYMASKNAIINNHLTIENLNKITYLCIDKENFITENKIIIKKICPLKEDTTLIIDALLSNQNYNDELYEQAFKNYLENKNIIIDYNQYKLIKRYPYNKKIKMEANIYEYENENYIYVKGNLESIFDICDLDLALKYQLHNLEKEYSKQGFEVIAVASKKVNKVEKNILNYDDIEFSGLIGLYNPPKENIKEIVKKIQNENIKIIMMSTDNKNISTHIGKTIGINNYENVLTLKEMAHMSDEELAMSIKNIGIICEISSQNKTRIINALKKDNEVIGITGNEITEKTIIQNAALLMTTKHSRTPLSKSLSNITLLNDNLETIINTINYSKIITQKTRKFIFSNFIVHISIIILSIIISTFSNQILLNIISILILEIIFNIIYILIFNTKKKIN